MSTNHLDQNIKDITRALQLVDEVIEEDDTLAHVYRNCLLKEILSSVRLKLKHEQVVRGNRD